MWTPDTYLSARSATDDCFYEIPTVTAAPEAWLHKVLYAYFAAFAIIVAC